MYSPKLPLPGGDDIYAKRQIGHSVRQDTLSEAAGPVEKQIVENARQDTRQDVMMLKTEQHDREKERCPGKRAQWDVFESLVDDVTDQK